MKNLMSLILVLGLIGCVSTKIDPNYLAYLQAAQVQPKIVEIEAKDGESIELVGVKRFIVYGVSGLQIEQHHQQLSIGAIIVKELFGTVRMATPYIVGGFAIDRLVKFGETAVKNAGSNVSDSYNTSGSYNIPTEYNYNDSYNGDYRDFTGDVDNSNNSINDSYNPVDRHDTYYPEPTEGTE